MYLHYVDLDTFRKRLGRLRPMAGRARCTVPPFWPWRLLLEIKDKLARPHNWVKSLTLLDFLFLNLEFWQFYRSIFAKWARKRGVKSTMRKLRRKFSSFPERQNQIHSENRLPNGHGASSCGFSRPVSKFNKKSSSLKCRNKPYILAR